MSEPGLWPRSFGTSGVADDVERGQDAEERNFYNGKMVAIVGRYVGDNERYFYLTRYKINCCAADAQPLKAPIGLPDQAPEKLAYKELQGKWVKVTGQVRFGVENQPMLVVVPTAERRLSALVEVVDPPAQPFIE